MSLGNFSQQADSYRRARPSYPAELVDLLVGDAEVGPGDPVVDFGAGTGIFTRLLVERGLRVTAVEPNLEMQLQNEAPEANWIKGTFESSGLASESQRWAVAAQAFHWADPPRSLPEIGRVLQPDCLFTVLWNNRAVEESTVLTWTQEAIRRHVPDFDEAYRADHWPSILESTGDFKVVGHRVVSHAVPMSRERYLDLWKSHNRLNVTAGPKCFASLLGEIKAHLQGQGIEEVMVPYYCEAWSARVNPE